MLKREVTGLADCEDDLGTHNGQKRGTHSKQSRFHPRESEEGNRQEWLLSTQAAPNGSGEKRKHFS